MDDLIIKALDYTFSNLSKQIKNTKKEVKFISIDGVNPYDFDKFIIDNNIPITAEFDIEGDGVIGLSWFEKKLLTSSELELTRKNIFESLAYRNIYNSLASNGFERINYADPVKESDIYSLYLNKQFDTIVEYYSLRFRKLK